MLEFLKAVFLGLHFSYYTTHFPTIHDLRDNVICDIAMYADDTILFSKFDQASVLWQQLELASDYISIFTC